MANQIEIAREAPDTVHGRLMEAIHLAGYSFERACTELDWLTENDRWKSCGGGYENFSEFAATIDLSPFRIDTEKRKHLAQKLTQLGASQRATAKALGVGKDTVARDLGARDDGADAPPELWDAASENGSRDGSGASAPPNVASPADDERGDNGSSAESQVKSWTTLEEWNALDAQARKALFRAAGATTFNSQETTNIEWARFSWNPITGCKHDCPYCYARDIAARFYPQAFEPSIFPDRLHAPDNTTVPAKASADISYRNVFTCSMADLFGRWVPAEWIEAVLQAVTRNNPKWNFLFLTKFPKRMSEFQYTENAWLGTTVDLQARVANAEKAFASVEAAVRWLSLEPLLEPLEFKHPELFDWVVIGGASRSTQTPEWHPPFEWVARLYCQFKDAGAKVYLKDNIGFDGANRPKGFPAWEDPDLRSAADVFHYLKNVSVADKRPE